jgi:hypothetical protein
MMSPLHPPNGTIAIWCYFRCKTCIYGNREMGHEMSYRLQNTPPTILTNTYNDTPYNRNTILTNTYNDTHTHNLYTYLYQIFTPEHRLRVLDIYTLYLLYTNRHFFYYFFFLLYINTYFYGL